MPDSSGRPPSAPSAELRTLVAELQALAAPAEQAFTDLGGLLGQTLERLGRLEVGVAAVSASLDADEAAEAMSAMREAIRSGAALAAGVSATDGLLQDVEEAAGRAVSPLAALNDIVGEIGALATNAKVLVAQIASSTIDFTVFTVEVARLRTQAGGVVSRATDRVRNLAGIVSAARRASDQIVRTNLREVDEMRDRLEHSLDALAGRQRLSRQAVTEMGQTSQAIAHRIAQCVGELQINDMTVQRIEHIWRAIELVCGLLDPIAGPAPSPDWAQTLDEEEKASLAAAVCRLQARQLDHAKQDFATEVDGLKANLRGLSEIAADVGRKAALAIDVRDGKDSFVRDLRTQSDRAAALLTSCSTAHAEVRGLVDRLALGFAELANDIGDLRSIDEDMRIMGLNATLKCGRLGSAGRALGVVAQELRGCSRRTEEATEPISEAIADTSRTAAQLAAVVADGEAEAARLSTSLANSAHALEALEVAVEEAFRPLSDNCSRISVALAEACDGLTVDHRMTAVMATAVARLTEIADAVDTGEIPAEATQAGILQLLGERYTMESERAIHGLFTEGAEAPADPEAASPQGTSVDDLFF